VNLEEEEIKENFLEEGTSEGAFGKRGTDCPCLGLL
jgi:hypothetical protein